MTLFRRTLLPCLLAALSFLTARLTAETAPVPLQGGETRSMTLQVAAGQFLGLVVEQDRVDLVVEVFDPQGRKLATADGPDYWMWEEEVALVAESSGTYRLEVHPFFDWAAPGFYRVRVEGPRAPRDADRTRIEALRELSAAYAFRQGTVERLEHLEKAIRIWRSLGDRRRELEALYQITEILGGLGRIREAVEGFHQTVLLCEELGLPVQQAWTLLESSRMSKGFFQGEEARRNMEEALSLAAKAGSRFLEARALQALGRFYEREPRTAVTYLEAAERLAPETGARELQMAILYQLGYTYDDLAEKQDALRCYKEALAIAHELQAAGVDVAGMQANAHNSLGHLYVSLGHWDEAVGHLEQALELGRKSHDPRKEAAALNNLALVYERLDPAKARDLYERSLAIVRSDRQDGKQQGGNRQGEVMTMNNLAFLDLRTGNPAGALERSRSALPLAAGDEESESYVRQAMGIAHRKLGDLEASRRELETALALARKRQDRFRQSQVIPELARTERMARDLSRAAALLEEGIRLLESLRTEVVQEELRAAFLASRQETYRFHIDTLMALDRVQPGRGHAAEALRASERARARTLLDTLAAAAADVHKDADPALIDRERLLLADIETIEQRRLKLMDQGTDSPEVREALARLAAAIEEHVRVQAELRESSPRYAALTQPQPLGLSEIQRDVLDGRALLLEYALGEERSYLWAVTADSLQSFELPSRERIEEAARRWYGALVVHPADPGYAEAAATARKAADELSGMLLRPVQELLRDQPLLVVGDGALQYLPFAALPAPDSLGGSDRVALIAGHEVVSLPSASALAVLRREIAGRAAAPKTLAVLADPVFQPDDPRTNRSTTRPGKPAKESLVRGGDISDRGDLRAHEVDPRRLLRLRFSEREAEAIAALVPESQRFKALGFAASRAMATGGELARYRMVHFATHGLIDSRRPEMSSLVLSLVNERGEPQNGFLRLHDIYNLELKADLVVLSACQTALGQEIRGEGLVGLTRGFMYAGAARVLASLWSVDDRATSLLMRRFYEHMITGGLRPAAALRQAQIDMSRDPQWRSPYYWAGFSLQGEWQ
ncbi:MAG TPA: CHAT domain-containing protein [Thermoanaerobaculia bacterium]|jgi:CHAT domain-containing protein|nr:CHAT domain-containing protein [Thermoanaerobaculia bacterium]